MTWRFNPHDEIAKSERPPAIPAVLAILDGKGALGIAGIAKIATASPHNEKIEGAQTSPPPAPLAEPVTSLTPAQCREVLSWPVGVQRQFVAHLDAHEAQGWPPAQAEALAYWAVVGEYSPP